MTKRELYILDQRVDEITSQLDTLDAHYDSDIIARLDSELDLLINRLESSHKQARIEESGFKLITSPERGNQNVKRNNQRI